MAIQVMPREFCARASATVPQPWQNKRRGLALAPLNISHRHGSLAQGGVDRAGMDAEMSSHLRKREPRAIEVLRLLDISRVQLLPPSGYASSVQVANDGAPVDLELRSEVVDATAVDIAPDKLSNLVGLQSPEDSLWGSRNSSLGPCRGDFKELPQTFSLVRGVQVTSHHLHHQIRWTPPKAHDFVGFRAVSPMELPVVTVPLIMVASGFEVIAEIEPATRPDLTSVRHQVGVLAPIARGFLIPDNHLGRATVSSIAVAHEVASMGVKAIACLNSRDRNRLGFRRDLLTAAAYGVDQFLRVFGDQPASGSRSTDLNVARMLEEVRAFGGSETFAGHGPFSVGVTTLTAQRPDLGAHLVSAGEYRLFERSWLKVPTAVYETYVAQHRRLRAGTRYR